MVLPSSLKLNAPSHLWTPPPPQNYVPPTWDEIRSQPLSPTLLRDIEARRAVGPTVDPDSPGANLYSNLAQIAFNSAQVQSFGDATLALEHFYPEGLGLLRLPVGSPLHEQSTYALADQYVVALKCMVRDVTALLDRLTNGMSVVTLLHPNPRLRSVAFHGSPPDVVHQTVFVTPRFVDGIPHSLHMPFRAALDTVAHIYAPIVADSYKTAIASADADMSSSPMQRQGPCSWLPTHTPGSSQYLLPVPTSYKWELKHPSDGTIYPPRPDVEDELQTTIMETNDLDLKRALKRLKRENSDLKTQVISLQQPTLSDMVVEYTDNHGRIASLQLDVEAQRRVNQQLSQLCQDLAAATFLPGNTPATRDRREFFERLIATLSDDGSGVITKWCVLPQEEYDVKARTIAELRNRLTFVAAQLDGERGMLLRVEARDRAWRDRVQLYSLYITQQDSFDWKTVVRASELPLVEADGWSSVLGPRTYDYLRYNALQYLYRSLYRVVSSLSPEFWAAAIEDKIHEDDVSLLSGLLLAVGADIVSGKIGAYNRIHDA
ncbi:hypothetical protein FISHEDRAFT_73838 [Fistulina hepatica ATCC 64428]|uniref:Uncharacterized protein n=1 Tax=Fistulina hepatica ATCC 64428 TaxID=1128425 RepID=A0A0D7ACX7_9AGAR|nr:hypothetical protein FISHEDRAFT_73838 [Fistulina hepatica ATCC 64428]